MYDEIASLRQREKFRTLLRDRGISLRKMSIDLNLNESYFQQFVAYGRPAFIEGNILRQAASYLNVSEESISSTSFSAPELLSASPALASRKAGDSALLLLPCYDLAQKLGNENWRDEQYLTQHMAFSRQMLQHITPTSPEQLVLLKISNDTMAPTLTKDDYALLDCSYQLASEDGIYAILHELRLLVKRLTVDPIRKQITLSRDNPTYPSIREYSLVDIQVAGRILWVGKRI